MSKDERLKVGEKMVKIKLNYWLKPWSQGINKKNMPAGLHGENGLDPQTAVHVFQIYVLPALLYGLEVAVPSKSNLDTLEKFLRTSLKQKLRVNRFKPASNFVLLIVPRRYFCGGSFCFMSWCLTFLCCWRLMYVFIFSIKLR